jgi:hypothetical protein
MFEYLDSRMREMKRKEKEKLEGKSDIYMYSVYNLTTVV